MSCSRTAVMALFCWLASIGAASADVHVDVRALSDAATAARAMPLLASDLLATNPPDRETRVRLLLVAGDSGAAEALIARLATLDAVRLENALANRDPFGSWSNAL